MRTNPIQPTSFGGLKIDGVISAENINKLSEFTKKIENNKFVYDLEKEFNTDLLLNDQVDTVSFSHKTYGSLSKYIKPSPIETIFSQVSELTSAISSAIRKAEKDFVGSRAFYEASRRGC